MKQYTFLLVFLISSFGFAQNAGLITGKLTDTESNNEPLIFAEVLIKETGAITTTDAEGFFHFENIKEGDYTIVCSFTGYEAKELHANVHSGKVTEVYSSLGASTVSLEELLTLASNETADKSFTSTK